jgi:hypothetical protein
MQEDNNEEQKKNLEEEIKSEIRKMLAEAEFLRKNNQNVSEENK